MIRKLPAVADRVETGAVQFGDDWPGVFIRGDNAAGYALAIRDVLTGEPGGLGLALSHMTLMGLRDILNQAAERQGE